MPRELPPLKYTMGFKVGNTNLPDPSVYTGAESDLDTMGERDATGYLHRNMVATKHPLKLEYHGISWANIMQISALVASDKFSFTYPSPFTGGTATMDAYVGDREFDCTWAPQNDTWVGNLKFSVIQY